MKRRYFVIIACAAFIMCALPAAARKPAQLEMHITKQDIDLNARQINFKLNKPAAKAETTFFDPGGGEITTVETDFKGASAGSKLTITWDPVGKSIGRIEIKAYDTQEFWVGYEIVPFCIESPHEEVVFESGKWDLRKSEMPKMDSALGLLKQAIAQYGNQMQASVYVGGFTDTVGSDSDNQLLSERRAKTLAVYFRKKGIKLSIFYRGFGEKVPAVPTPDSTDEEKNRRATYILAAMTPEIGGPDAPGKWRLLSR